VIVEDMNLMHRRKNSLTGSFIFVYGIQEESVKQKDKIRSTGDGAEENQD
jgi:hypothetical protein